MGTGRRSGEVVGSRGKLSGEVVGSRGKLRDVVGGCCVCLRVCACLCAGPRLVVECGAGVRPTE
eukprot:5649386-Prymnesium_polylepis.1